MNIHEYQGKELFKQYGIPVMDQAVVSRPEDAGPAAVRLGGKVVVKAQVLVGGRGKAGGVKLANGADDAVAKARAILGMDIKGNIVEKVMVTPASDIKREYYVGLTVDRTSKQALLMLSKAGGVDIEDLAKNRPQEILRFGINAADGIDAGGLKDVIGRVFDTPSLAAQADDAIRKLYKLFTEKDCSLVEINPYALIADDKLVALDAKVNFDDNALYRHDDIEKLRNSEEYSEDEIAARKAGLSFVSMDGEIGCIVNGAGLAMATMDIIKLFGGSPANFLDVGGSSNPEKVLNALRIILNNKKVKAILINIFGGITRCDDIARGILMAMEQIDIKLPMVIRLIGTNEEEGRRMLRDAGIVAEETLNAAVKKVVSYR
ncbi:MAG TPA: ADP-forming succinate--CoA ligase subunit beta [Spirochaetia bacterium]|nr:ADP-forming succinate--CoA ligase subunit beta [Spirochaetia bacterium]